MNDKYCNNLDVIVIVIGIGIRIRIGIVIVNHFDSNSTNK